MATEYGGQAAYGGPAGYSGPAGYGDPGGYGGQAAYGGPAGYGGQPAYGGQPGFPPQASPSVGGEPVPAGQSVQAGQPVLPDQQGRARRKRGRFVAGILILVLGLAGLTASLVGITTQLLPRKFTAGQQQQIMAWEVGERWRTYPAGRIFPASVNYTPPSFLMDGSSLSLAATRIGIARQASCKAAADSATAKVLDRNGCAALLRATYVDGTDSYVVTVGVAAFPSAARAVAAEGELVATPGTGPSGEVRPGIMPARFAGTPASEFTINRRQISSSISDGPYIVLYTIGYADNRPRVPISADDYADSEMTSMGVGVANSVADVLGKTPTPPHCPGAPGC